MTKQNVRDRVRRDHKVSVPQVRFVEFSKLATLKSFANRTLGHRAFKMTHFRPHEWKMKLYQETLLQTLFLRQICLTDSGQVVGNIFESQKTAG